MKAFEIFFIFAAGFFLLVQVCDAHEHRKVAGNLDFVVGFLNEPAFSGEMNGVDLRVSLGGEPVEGLGETLKASVSRKDVSGSLELPFRGRYKQPGAYAAYFLPAKPGQYIFRIIGTAAGREVNEVFTSGPETFGDVQDSAPLRFPEEN